MSTWNYEDNVFISFIIHSQHKKYRKRFLKSDAMELFPDSQIVHTQIKEGLSQEGNGKFKSKKKT